MRLEAETIEMTIDSRDGLDQMLQMFSETDIEFPVRLTIDKRKKTRTLIQNNTANKWYRDCEKQGDMKAWEYKAYCKLHFGVPILRRDSVKYKEMYDTKVKEFPYETKLMFMAEPYSFPVTSMMNVAQHSEFLEMVERHFSQQGFELTEVRK